jgi:mannose/fructose/N-acetylgalactosamine-specific phosphotransferase system component IID
MQFQCRKLMYLVVIAWMYVVLMWAVTEALSPNGTLMGAFFTFVLYGVLPMAIYVYIGRTGARKRARLAREAAERATPAAAVAAPDAENPPTPDK